MAITNLSWWWYHLFTRPLSHHQCRWKFCLSYDLFGPSFLLYTLLLSILSHQLWLSLLLQLVQLLEATSLWPYYQFAPSAVCFFWSMLICWCSDCFCCERSDPRESWHWIENKKSFIGKGAYEGKSGPAAIEGEKQWLQEKNPQVAAGCMAVTRIWLNESRRKQLIELVPAEFFCARTGSTGGEYWGGEASE